MLNKELLLMRPEEKFGTLTVKGSSDDYHGFIELTDGSTMSFIGVSTWEISCPEVVLLVVESHVLEAQNMVETEPTVWGVVNVREDAYLELGGGGSN